MVVFDRLPGHQRPTLAETRLVEALRSATNRFDFASSTRATAHTQGDRTSR